jgi:hypothetical protein
MRRPAPLLLLTLLLVSPAFSQVRREIAIPDLPDYRTLVCDFHMHTVFSDGTVWPTVRIDEAWRTGLDVIAISDHIEYQPHAEDIPTKHNRPFALCVERAKQHGIELIRAAEITRGTPPGHFNAIFLKNAEALEQDDFMAAVAEANTQGGFVFWNHHDWKGPDKGSWFEVHQKLFDEKLLHGMEVANGRSYYPRAHQWCLDKNLTMFGNSDIHPPDLRRETSPDDHRTATLVFVSQPGVDGIREALVNRRTAVWFEDQVIGRRELLEPLFEACVSVDPPHHRQGNQVWVKVRNRSEFNLQLTRAAGPGPRQLSLPAESVTLVKLRLAKPDQPAEFRYTVDNFLIAPETTLPIVSTLRESEDG